MKYRNGLNVESTRYDTTTTNDRMASAIPPIPVTTGFFSASFFHSLEGSGVAPIPAIVNSGRLCRSWYQTTEFANALVPIPNSAAKQDNPAAASV